MGADPARGISDGRDRFVARCARILADVQSVHHGHMQEIEVLDATRATAITAMFDRLEFADGRVQTGYGHYEEDYALDAGRGASRA